MRLDNIATPCCQSWSNVVGHKLRIATLTKSREELIGDIVSLLQSPAKNVISALQGNAGQKVAGIVKALEERNN